MLVIDYRLIIVTLIMIVLDLVIGFTSAVKDKNVHSEKLRQGLWHKSGFIGLLVLAYVLEYAATIAELGIAVPAVSATCIYIIVTETVSVFENLCKWNPALVNSPIGSIFKHDEKVQEAAALLASEREGE